MRWQATRSAGVEQAVTHLLGSVIGEQASAGPCIVLLDEVKSLAADRRKMSMDANPVDVHRATDAVLTQLDQLAASNTQLLFIATSNFPGAIDDAFLSRADLVVTVELPTADACRAILLDTLARVGRIVSQGGQAPDGPADREGSGRSRRAGRSPHSQGGAVRAGAQQADRDEPRLAYRTGCPRSP